MARTCIFCEAEGVTAEHVFPQWLSNTISRPGGFRLEAEHVGVRNWQQEGAGIDFTVNAVCDGCNSGWMSDLEGRVRPVLAPFLQGSRAHLSSSAQALLARWAVKTAMVLEHAGASTHSRYYSAEERRAFRTDGSIPATTLIWLARLDAPGVAALGWEDNLSIKVEQGNDVRNDGQGHLAAVAVGALAVIVVSLRMQLPAGAELELPHLEPWSATLVPISSGGAEVVWPPPRWLSLKSLQEFVARWTQPRME